MSLYWWIGRRLREKSKYRRGEKRESSVWRGRNEGVSGGEGRGERRSIWEEREGKDVSQDSAEKTFCSLRLVISYRGQN